MHRLLVCALFFASGAAGLIYQVVWVRKLTLILGVTSQAVATVLAVFMGGLALGSWLFGRAADDTRSPLRLYGWLELGIALFGVQSLFLLDGLVELYVDLRRSGGLSPTGLACARVGLAGLALLGPTTLMGATLPILVRGACRTRDQIASRAGVLYGINTLGAVAGTLGSAFFLIQAVGMRGSVALAAGLNLFVGIVALFLARSAPPLALESEGDDLAPPQGVEPAERRLLRRVLCAFGASGFLALAYEVVWTRYLIYVVGENSVYAFSTMLAAFLIGIALGSFLAAAIADRVERLDVLFGFVLVAMGASALGTVALMDVLADASRLRGAGDFWSQSAQRLLQSLGVLIVPTTLSGTTFALVAKIYARQGASLGRDVGRAYAANTLGAILGALAGGFLVLPHLGLVWGLAVLAAANVLVGSWVLLARAEPALRVALLGLVLAGGAAASLTFAPNPRERLLGSEERLLYYADGPESSVAIVESKRTGTRHLLVDGDGQAGTEPSMQIHLRLLGHLPALFHPDPRKALVVAYGSGITTGSLAQHPVESVDLVELSRTVLAGAPHFAPWNHDALNDPKVRLIHDDGRNFLLCTDERYDLITSDPIDPDDAGVTSLYSREYYELVRSRLAPGGLACQWITTQYDREEYWLLVRTFASVFPHTSIWYADFTTVVVGSVEPPRASLATLDERFADPAIAASLQAVGIDSPETLLSLQLAGPEEVRRLVGEGPLNTDDRPRIEYLGPRVDVEDDNYLDLWKALAGARRGDRSDWVAAWSSADEERCATADRWMDAVLERYLHDVEAYEELARAEREATPSLFSGAVQAADPDERDRETLERAPQSDARSRRYLDLTWEILGGEVPRLFLILLGFESEEPDPDLAVAERQAYEADLAKGRSLFEEGRDEEALEFLERGAEHAGGHRARLLLAAARDRLGDPMGALEEALRVDGSRLSEWSELHTLTEHLFQGVLAAMEVGGLDRRLAGERLVALTPDDASRPAQRGQGRFGGARSEEGLHPRPVETPGNVDRWRLWWHDARPDLRAYEGRYVWRLH